MAARYLTSEEKGMISVALNMRKCYIETGSISLGASTIAKMGAKASKQEFGAEIKALNENQMKLILATGELERNLLNNKIFIDD